MSKWSHKLDNYLVNNKISKKQLASELGVSINTLQKWWGNREPSQEHVVKIQELLSDDISDTTAISDNSFDSVGREANDDEIVASQLIKQGERDKERSVVISLLRTTCPFCKNAIIRFRHCTYCGQHFVWANMPLSESL